MDASDSQTGDEQQPAQATAAAPLSVFINYRRSDTGEVGRLCDRLKARFGAENVFMDVENLEPGQVWPKELRARSSSCAAFLAVIGPKWLDIVQEREHKKVDPKEDQVELEIVSALREKRPIFPVLMGRATMPDTAGLPRSIKGLTAFNAQRIRTELFDRDVQELIAALEKLDSDAPESVDEPAAALRERITPHAAELSAPQPVGAVQEQSTPTPREPNRPSPAQPGGLEVAINRDAPAPEQAHYDEVVREMLEYGNVVPLLGSRVNGAFPDAADLAADLARRFERSGEPEPRDLAEIAQYVSVTRGSPDLNTALREALAAEVKPRALHHFLASFPGRARELGREHYQMLVTTNYDNALEEAFKEQDEPYDLAIYMASGKDKGKFVHFPSDTRTPEPIEKPNEYVGFPMHDSGELWRTLIVKIHGTVDGAEGSYRWSNNYVITEDHYIDYLRGSAIEGLVPFQILDKLTSSHCLFLGYSMRDWILRVFLKRIWSGERLEATSWAIEQNPDRLEARFWKAFDVELFATPLDDYVQELSRSLGACATPT